MSRHVSSSTGVPGLPPVHRFRRRRPLPAVAPPWRMPSLRPSAALPPRRGLAARASDGRRLDRLPWPRRPHPGRSGVYADHAMGWPSPPWERHNGARPGRSARHARRASSATRAPPRSSACPCRPDPPQRATMTCSTTRGPRSTTAGGSSTVAALPPAPHRHRPRASRTSCRLARSSTACATLRPATPWPSLDAALGPGLVTAPALVEHAPTPAPMARHRGGRPASCGSATGCRESWFESPAPG